MPRNSRPSRPPQPPRPPRQAHRPGRAPRQAGPQRPAYPSAEGPGPADLVIVGAGAAGLMAAVTAAERGLRTILLERRQRPGLKLLMCGNGRCNVTHEASADALCARLGPPVDAFVAEAVRRFPPAALREWFQRRGLETVVRRGGRVFPLRERAADVLQLFTDELRLAGVPLCTQAAVTGIAREERGLDVQTATFMIPARHVLLCTGGVTYPKTGSIGDGQRFAQALGHTVTRFRPGLAGVEIRETWPAAFEGTRFEDVRCTARNERGADMTLTGDLEIAPWGLGGGVISDLTRRLSREEAQPTQLRVDLAPQRSINALAEALRGGDGSASVRRLCRGPFADIPPGLFRALEAESSGGQSLSPEALAAVIKAVVFTPTRIRPLKEAMVTVGGVALDDVDPSTMASRHCPGLSFAGEILDIDGPTGGFNLHLAFCSARLAVQSIP